jgi:ZIP family zinc transporter
MISIVFLELIPKAKDHSNTAVAIIGLIMGVFLVFLLNNLMDRISGAGKQKSKLHGNYAEFFHASGVITNKNSMLRAGMIMLFAIGLHNIPEGLAMGAAGYLDANLGLTLAIIIGLHNIPEGMAVSAPLIAGGLSKTKSVALTLFIGSTTVIGAIAGVIIGGISDIAVAISFSMAGGAMLYAVLSEIFPQSIVTNKDRVPTIFALAGIVIGILFTQI